MRIGSAGSTNINLLQSDSFTFRNQDYISSQARVFTYGGNQGNGGLTYAIPQIYNPIGSGVTVLLDRVLFSTNGAGFTLLERIVSSFGTKQSDWRNMLLGDVDGQAEIYGHSSAFSIGSLYGQYYTGAGVIMELNFPYPFILEEDYGLALSHIGTNIAYNFYGREV